MLELNSLRTEKTCMLIKINELEERLLETQLQLERVSDEKLTHMLYIQKCPTDKTGLGYIPSSDTPSTSKTIFVKPVIPDTPPPKVDKGKAKMEAEVSFIPQGTSDLTAHIGKFKGRKNGRLLKLPCVNNVELAVMSNLGILL